MDLCMVVKYKVTPVSWLLSLGVGGWKDLFCEDPRSLGSVSHLRRRAEDQGPIQGQRHPRQPRDADELADHAFPSAGARDAPRPWLLHSSLQQEQVRLLPYRRRRDLLPPFYSQQDSKAASLTTFLSCLSPSRENVSVLSAGWLVDVDYALNVVRCICCDQH